MRDLFENELEVMTLIKHPNVLHLHEYLQTPTNYYLVLDYCNNGDLEIHLNRNQCLGEQESLYLLDQIKNGF